VNVFIRCINFTLTYNENDLGNSIKFGAYKIWCSQWRIGHCLVCTGHCPVPSLEHLMNWPLLGFLRAIPLKFIGLSGAPLDCPVSQQSNGQLLQRSTTEQSDRQKSENSLRCRIALNCPMPQEDRRLQRSTTSNHNGQLTWHSPDSEQ
jgi:hypothetical protein